METSTVLFIAVLAVGFIFLRWLITPIPHDVPPEVEELRNQSNRANGASSSASSSATGARANSGATGTSTGTRRTNRDITESMVEVVQAIAPQLTPGQIRHDLRRTGSVEVTINRYMETGSLPFPPGEAPAPRQTGPGQATDPHNIPPSTVSLNLLEKYGLDEGDGASASATGDKSSTSAGTSGSATGPSTGSAWGSSKAERSSLLHKKRQEMILNARKRLANQLQNDISGDLSGKM